MQTSVGQFAEQRASSFLEDSVREGGSFKKGGRKGKPASAAAQAALANAKARPQKKSGAKGGRSEGGPRAAKTGKSQNDKCLP